MACGLFGDKPIPETKMTCYQSDPREQIRWNLNNKAIVVIHKNECLWKCRLQNGAHFVSASMRGQMNACCRGPNASNPARGRTLPGQERPSNGRPDASQRRPGSMLCPVGLPGALSVDILALLLYWPTYAPITVRLTIHQSQCALCTVFGIF